MSSNRLNIYLNVSVYISTWINVVHKIVCAAVKKYPLRTTVVRTLSVGVCMWRYGDDEMIVWQLIVGYCVTEVSYPSAGRSVSLGWLSLLCWVVGRHSGSQQNSSPCSSSTTWGHSADRRRIMSSQTWQVSLSLSLSLSLSPSFYLSIYLCLISIYPFKHLSVCDYDINSYHIIWYNLCMYCYNKLVWLHWYTYMVKLVK